MTPDKHELSIHVRRHRRKPVLSAALLSHHPRRRKPHEHKKKLTPLIFTTPCRYQGVHTKKKMTEKEFTDMATSLRGLALKHARTYVGADEAEDIAQDTMLRLWSLRDGMATEANANRLAVTITRHLAIDRLRKQRTVSLETLQDMQLNGKDAEPDIAMEDEQNEQWLRNQMKNLPQNEYLVLRLRQVEQKSNDEIAAILGIKPASVPVLLSRARHKLLDALNKQP